MALSESLRKIQSSPTIPKGQYSSEKNIGLEKGKKQSGVKRQRLSSKSIAFSSPNSNFENIDFLDAKFESKTYRKPSTADFHGKTPAKKRKNTFNRAEMFDFSPSNGHADNIQKNHFFGCKPPTQPSVSLRPPALHSRVQVQDVDKKDMMITHLLNMVDKMQRDYSKLTEECLRANKELFAVKLENSHGTLRKDSRKSKISQVSNNSPSKFSAIPRSFSKKVFPENSPTKKRIKILGQEVAIPTYEALGSMNDYADSDNQVRNFVTHKVFDCSPSDGETISKKTISCHTPNDSLPSLNANDQ